MGSSISQHKSQLPFTDSNMSHHLDQVKKLHTKTSKARRRVLTNLNSSEPMIEIAKEALTLAEQTYPYHYLHIYFVLDVIGVVKLFFFLQYLLSKDATFRLAHLTPVPYNMSFYLLFFFSFFFSLLFTLFTSLTTT